MFITSDSNNPSKFESYITDATELDTENSFTRRARTLTLPCQATQTQNMLEIIA